MKILRRTQYKTGFRHKAIAGPPPVSWDIRDDTGADIKNNQNGWALHSVRAPFTDEVAPAGEWHAAYGGLNDFDSQLFRYHTDSGLDADTQWTIEFEIKFDSLDTFGVSLDGQWGFQYYTGSERWYFQFFADQIQIREEAAFGKATDYTPNLGNYETYRVTIDAGTNAVKIYQDTVEIYSGTFSDTYAGMADELFLGGYDRKGDASTVDIHLKTWKVASGIYIP